MRWNGKGDEFVSPYLTESNEFTVYRGHLENKNMY